MSEGEIARPITEPAPDIYDRLLEKGDEKLAAEVRKALVLGALDAGKDYCKSMVTTCTAAAGAYLGIVSWFAKASEWGTTATPVNSLVRAGLIFGPVLLFAAAAVGFTNGYHGHPLGSADPRPEPVVGDVLRESRWVRRVWGDSAGLIFWCGVAASIWAVASLLLTTSAPPTGTAGGVPRLVPVAQIIAALVVVPPALVSFGAVVQLQYRVLPQALGTPAATGSAIAKPTGMLTLSLGWLATLGSLWFAATQRMPLNDALATAAVALTSCALVFWYPRRRTRDRIARARALELASVASRTK